MDGDLSFFDGVTCHHWQLLGKMLQHAEEQRLLLDPPCVICVYFHPN